MAAPRSTQASSANAIKAGNTATLTPHASSMARVRQGSASFLSSLASNRIVACPARRSLSETSTVYEPGSTRLPKAKSERSAFCWSPPTPRKLGLKDDAANCCAMTGAPHAPSAAAHRPRRKGTHARTRKG
ncbi:hypothetical protein [Variovorax sp. UC122_21]|uniref:hypothetical protein n=1 Tax=Variovorax sp. UC122_21 TaxID=3374554 RepID=UPI0037572E03